MHGGCDRIQKAGVRVLRKVSDDLCAGRDRAGHFNIQHHFAIRAVRVSGGIVAAVADRNRRHGGRLGQLELAPVIAEIRRVVTAAQFDQRDTFSGSVYACGKVVKRGDLNRRVGQAHGSGTDAAAPLPPTKMRFGLRAIIQAKDTFDHVLQFRRKVDRSCAPAVSTVGMLVFLQFDAKRFVHGSNRSGENDGPAAWALFLHREFVLPGK